MVPLWIRAFCARLVWSCCDFFQQPTSRMQSASERQHSSEASSKKRSTSTHINKWSQVLGWEWRSKSGAFRCQTCKWKPTKARECWGDLDRTQELEPDEKLMTEVGAHAISKADTDFSRGREDWSQFIELRTLDVVASKATIRDVWPHVQWNKVYGPNSARTQPR